MKITVKDGSMDGRQAPRKRKGMMKYGLPNLKGKPSHIIPLTS